MVKVGIKYIRYGEDVKSFKMFDFLKLFFNEHGTGF